MLISLSKKFAFFHIPKTGGVSIRKALERYKDIGSLQYRQYLKRNVDSMHVNQEFAYKFFDLSDLTEFTVVREPYSRLVSLYNYGKNPSFFDSFAEFMQVVAKHYERPSRYRELYNSQLHWITDRTLTLKLEDIIVNTKLEFAKINVTDIKKIDRENVNKNINYYIPNKKEMSYCLDMLSEEYIKLNYEKPKIEVEYV